ncbi:unnamed protein product [Onchocerca flexuosa]|uniref:M protein repeat protein n=1 Tax=Onchocerca flexuosa TaxID=387005 RepID=A0A183GZG9_9BILA|nr:unnamed protein product [Onchocerca flexuosa]
MSSSSDQKDDRKNRTKRQSIDSPLAVMSPSVRPQSAKLFRLSKTPAGPKLANINQVDPNIDATFLEQCSVERCRAPAVINYSDPNIEQSSIEETLQSEETVKEASTERSIVSECDDVVNITDVTSSSVADVLSPGMSNDMKSAIKIYLKSTSTCSVGSLESKAKHLVIDNVALVGQSENPDELNMDVSSNSQERTAEKNSESSIEVDLSVPVSELAVGVTEATSCSEISYDTIGMKDIFKTSFTKVSSSPYLQVENAEYLTVPKSLAKQVDEIMTHPNMPENLTLSARKNKVLTTRNLKLDNLSSPRELANYAEERAQNYSFLINEAYCDTSVFCENCYAMRIELGLFSDKFAALTANIENSAAEGNMAFVAELENLLREKQAKIVTLSSELRDLTQANDHLSKQKEIVEKDAEDYKFFFKNEMEKKSEEMSILRRKLYEAEDLIDELKQAKPKQSSEENILQAEVELGCQMEVRIKTMERQLDTAHSLHQKSQERIKQLENQLQKITEEKNQLSLKLRETVIDLENERSNQAMSDESSHVLIISLLEAKVAELGNKIDEALHVRKDETVIQKSFLFEKLTSLLEKIRSDVKNDVFAKEWKAGDVEISVMYFEKAINIICQDIPQFEMLIETVAQHEKLAKNELKQLEAMMEEAMNEKKKWEKLFTSEKSRLDSLQEVMLTQFCENKNYFSNLLQKLNEEWSKDLNELQGYTSCLKEQHLTVTSLLKSEMQKMSNKIEMLLESIEKNSNALLNNLQADDTLKDQEAKHKSLMDFVKNQLRDYEREKDTFKEMREHSEEMKQDLKKMIEQLQKVEEGIKFENAALHKNLGFERDNFARIIHVTENLIMEKDKLENKDTGIKSTISRLTGENTDFKETEKASNQQEKKIEELEHKLNLLQKENERLGKACDDADEEVGDLKQQIFELLRINAKLQAEMHGESEEAINRRLGYIEPPTIQPKINPSTLETASEINSPKQKVTDMTENLLESNLDAEIENVLVEKAELEERKKIQKFEKEDILAEATTKKISTEESPKSKAIQDQSCRTS